MILKKLFLLFFFLNEVETEIIEQRYGMPVRKTGKINITIGANCVYHPSYVVTPNTVLLYEG